MKHFRLPAVSLRAAAGSKPRRLLIAAYNGGLMSVPGFGPIVLDLAGMQIPHSLPILGDHKNELGAVIATGKPSHDGKALTVHATVADTEAGREVCAILETGSLQASIGADVVSSRIVRPGESVQANGRTHTSEAAFEFIEASALREVSVVALGCDSSSYVTLAAKRLKGTAMSFEQWCESIGTDPAALTDAQRVELEKAHAALYPPAGPTDDPPAVDARRGVSALEAARIFSDPSTTHLLGRAIVERWDARRCADEALRTLLASRPQLNTAPLGGGGPRSTGAVGAQHLTAALMTRAGYAAAAEKAYGPNVMEQSRRLHGTSMPDLCATALRIDGREPPRDRNLLIKAALSTGSMPVALGDSANKIMETVYQLAPASWRSWCAVRSAANFKVQSSVRPSFIGDLEEVGDGGIVKHNRYEESVITWSIGQFAKKLSVGRKSVVNDDLSVFSEVLPSLAKAALRSLATAIYTKLLANTGSHFGSGNANYMSGGTTNLTVASLATAVLKMRQQTDADDNTLDLQPAVLLVPPELEVLGRSILNSVELSRVATGDQLPTGNPFQSLAKLEVEGRLSNTAYSGSSTTAWYLFASPADVPFIVGFLDGVETPQTETFDFSSDSDRLEMSWRVIHDYGCGYGDFRAGVKSVGA